MENKRVAIIISSDSGYRGEREDASGPVIKEIVESKGYQVVSTIILLPDLSIRLSNPSDFNTNFQYEYS